MSFFQDFIEGIARGVSSALTDNRAFPGNSESGRIERLCRELGWAVDERVGEAIRLHFKDTHGSTRLVSIGDGDGDLVLFIASSLVSFRDPPDELMGYVLARSAQTPFGGWTVTDADNGTVVFVFLYRALGGGLTAPALRSICEAMVGETAEFDAKLRGAGFLR
ncbi:MAG TPA: YbjN domain-containing protein [Gemmataceae bacterium]|nr:YbjN domain-containing protein [Gemmataceae bacterium]